MCVNCHGGFFKDHRRDHIGRFTAHTRQFHQIVYLARNFALIIFYQHLRHANQMFGLVVRVTDASNIRKNSFGCSGRHRFGVGIILKQGRSCKVNPLVGTLRAQNYRYQQLKWILIMKFGLSRSHMGFKKIQNMPVTLLFGHTWGKFNLFIYKFKQPCVILFAYR